MTATSHPQLPPTIESTSTQHLTGRTRSTRRQPTFVQVYDVRLSSSMTSLSALFVRFRAARPETVRRATHFRGLTLNNTTSNPLSNVQTFKRSNAANAANAPSAADACSSGHLPSVGLFSRQTKDGMDIVNATVTYEHCRLPCGFHHLSLGSRGRSSPTSRLRHVRMTAAEALSYIHASPISLAAATHSWVFAIAIYSLAACSPGLWYRR